MQNLEGSGSSDIQHAHQLGDFDRSKPLLDEALELWNQYMKSRRKEDLDKSIGLYRAALTHLPEGHPNRHHLLNIFASSLGVRFKLCHQREDLDECIRLHRAALALRPNGHPDRHHSLHNLAASLGDRFRLSHQREDLGECIWLARAALALRPDGHPNRHDSLNNLAASLSDRFRLSHQREDLDECIRLNHAALSLFPGGHPNRHDSLNNLAVSLSDRFNLSHQREDLDECIRLYHAALAILPDGHPNRHISLNNLAVSLSHRFDLSHQREDLDECIRLNRAALSLFPEGHPNRHDSLNNLAVSLSDRFRLSHQREDLDECIRLHRAALAVLPDGHPNRHSSLNNLAVSLSHRFDLSHQREDLDECVRLNRAALAFRPDGHPSRHYSLNNLASSLRDRFNLSHQREDLDECIRLYRAALSLFPDDHPDRHYSLNNLATSLSDLFNLSHQREDLDECIRLNRAALALRPDGHPSRHYSLNNLAASLRNRFDLSHQREDLDECIRLHRAARVLLPEGHPDHSLLLNSIASSLRVRFEKTRRLDDLEESLELRKSAASYPYSSSFDRLKGAVDWSADARKHNHPSSLEAYEVALSLLQRTLILSPNLQRQHDLLIRSFPTLALDAASYAIEKGDIHKAVEMLEQGRGLLWSQMRGFRTPLDKLAKVDQPLADRLKDISGRLEALSTMTNMQQATSSDAHENHNSFDEELKLKYELSMRQERTFKEIRSKPGFENFLLEATSFSTLRCAADEGPVIIVNHCKYRSDCIIVLKESEPVCIPLSEKFYKDAQDQVLHLIETRKELKDCPKKFDGALQLAQEWLWESVVSLVVEKLTELGFPKQSRIWWCTTSILPSLPFHVAGPSGVGPLRYLIDDYISSYTPTLQALIDSRSGPRPAIDESRELFSLLVVGQPGKEQPLPNVSKEIGVIRKHATAVTALYLEEEQTTKALVMEKIRSTTWAHFACHGHLKPGQPFESSFELFNDERLTLLNIIENKLPNAELAFLSACHSAEQTPGSAHDEVLHLAAGMLFCGYRSVIGTMWEMSDEDGPFVADRFYKRMLPKKNAKRRDYKDSARALQKTILLLRAEGDSIERWVNFIHIGA